MDGVFNLALIKHTETDWNTGLFFMLGRIGIQKVANSPIFIKIHEML